MSVRNAIFVDVENLNVIYKLRDRFVTALSYADNIERLSEMAATLGTGYDIYLCMKPLMPGEGDIVLDELSVVGMPFSAKKADLLKLLKFFRGFYGANTVYLCNWIHNYVSSARVSTFESVLYYGSGIVRVEARDGDIADVKFWKDQQEFSQSSDVDDDTYGDLGLLDVDGLRAQFPEVSDMTNAALTAITPLLRCYHTPVKLDTEALYEALAGDKPYGSSVVQNDEPLVVTDDPAIAPSEEVNTPPVVIEDNDTRRAAPKTRIPTRASSSALTMLLVVVSCVACAVLGAMHMEVLEGPETYGSPNFYSSVDERIADLNNLASIYREGATRATDLKNVYEFCVSTEAELTIVGFEFVNGDYTVRYNCVSNSESDAFADYLSTRYTVTSLNTLGVVAVDGQQVQQYRVSFN